MRTGFNLSVLFFSAFIFFTACDEETVIPLVDETNNGFQSKEVAEIFAQNCLDAGCHGNSEPHHDLKFTTYSEMIKGSIGRTMDHPLDKIIPNLLMVMEFMEAVQSFLLMLKKVWFTI